MSLDATIGGADAESYVSVHDADAYHDARGNTTWVDADDDVKEQLLRKATAYLDGKFRTLWKGQRSTEVQTLAWPRKHVLDEDGRKVDETILPRPVIQATCEAA